MCPSVTWIHTVLNLCCIAASNLPEASESGFSSAGGLQNRFNLFPVSSGFKISCGLTGTTKPKTSCWGFFHIKSFRLYHENSAGSVEYTETRWWFQLWHYCMRSVNPSWASPASGRVSGKLSKYNILKGNHLKMHILKQFCEKTFFLGQMRWILQTLHLQCDDFSHFQTVSPRDVTGTEACLVVLQRPLVVTVIK